MSVWKLGLQDLTLWLFTMFLFLLELEVGSEKQYLTRDGGECGERAKTHVSCLDMTSCLKSHISLLPLGHNQICSTLQKEVLMCLCKSGSNSMVGKFVWAHRHARLSRDLKRDGGNSALLQSTLHCSSLWCWKCVAGWDCLQLLGLLNKYLYWAWWGH